MSIPLLLLTALLLGPVPPTVGAPFPEVREHAMVVTAHPLATRVGVQVLLDGGNAVDAAVAVGYALAVVLPEAGNIGGGGFMVIRRAAGVVTTIDFRERAPLKAHRDMYLNAAGEADFQRSQVGHLAAGVPGTVAGLSYALERYGTRPLSVLVAPAVRLADEGFALDWVGAQALRGAAELFRRFPGSTRAMLRKGEPYRPGDWWMQRDLAGTLRAIARDGPAAFYRGRIAGLIVAEMERGGGLITGEDLRQYAPHERPPVVGTYHGYTVSSMPPPSSGGIALVQLLNILEAYDLRAMGHNSSASVHLLAEAARRVYADRAEYLGDPDFVDVPVQALVDKAHAARLRTGILVDRATPSSDVHAGLPGRQEHRQTTHYSVVDRWGNAVACTYTLNGGFGSHVVVEGAGFLLNNEMDDFSAKPGAPNMYGLIGGEANAIVPGKRMLSSMTPTIVERDGRLVLVTGSPGGSRIITTVLQVVLNVLDHRMNLKEAVTAPRVHHQWMPDELQLEPWSLSRDVQEALTRRGHHLTQSSYMGDAHSIFIDPQTGFRHGAADPRGRGTADGY